MFFLIFRNGQTVGAHSPSGRRGLPRPLHNPSSLRPSAGATPI